MEASNENVLDAISRHRSIRKYAAEPLSDEELERILTAATRASTSGNMQTYSIVATRDADLREKLYELHYHQGMIRTAAVVLTFCVDWNRMNKWCRASDTEPGYDNFLSFLVGFADVMIAAQNAALAAEALGYGICYMGTTLGCTQGLVELLELPRGVFPATSLVVGVPDEEPKLVARLPLESIVHREKYQDFDETRIAETYHERETEGWKRYQQYPELAKKVAESGVENLAQVYTQLKYTRKTNDLVSGALLDALRAQGFLEE